MKNKKEAIKNDDQVNRKMIKKNRLKMFIRGTIFGGGLVLICKNDKMVACIKETVSGIKRTLQKSKTKLEGIGEDYIEK